ncbi:MAG: hypothetical protein ACLQNV_07395 [Steroidobacteraceae bacterium]|jgi:hypothetical protein
MSSHCSHGLAGASPVGKPEAEMTLRGLLIGMTVAGTLIVPTTSAVAAQPQQGYSILDAGARCDGVTDDSAKRPRCGSLRRSSRICRRT